jgi:hypothetical protein
MGAFALSEAHPARVFCFQKFYEHLVAIVIVSRCCVVCTDDEMAIAYLRNPKVFRRYKVKRPKIYRHKTHVGLCCDANVAPVCRG